MYTYDYTWSERERERQVINWITAQFTWGSWIFTKSGFRFGEVLNSIRTPKTIDMSPVERIAPNTGRRGVNLGK